MSNVTRRQKIKLWQRHGSTKASHQGLLIVLLLFQLALGLAYSRHGDPLPAFMVAARSKRVRRGGKRWHDQDPWRRAPAAAAHEGPLLSSELEVNEFRAVALSQDDEAEIAGNREQSPPIWIQTLQEVTELDFLPVSDVIGQERDTSPGSRHRGQISGTSRGRCRE